MDCFIRCTGIEHSLPGIDIHNLSTFYHNACWRVHPGIRTDDKPGRSQAANPDEKRAKPVRAGRETIPTIEIESQENSFQKKSKPFQGKRQPHNCSGKFCIGWPEQSQLKGKYCT